MESLSSWLDRLARLYNLPVKDLLTHNLGLLDLTVPADLDHDPPAAMLAALAGWVPWLFDTVYLRQWDAQTTFETYVRENTVLFAPGEAGTNQVSRWKRWGGPWFPHYWLHRACPVCAADPDRGKA